MRTKIVLLFIFLLTSFKAFAGEMLDPKNMDELQANISQKPNTTRSFYVEFPYPFSTEQVNSLASTYKLFPLELRGTYDANGEVRHFSIDDFTTVNGNLKSGISKSFWRHNKRVSSGNHSSRIKKYQLTDSPNEKSSHSAHIKWVRLKALGTYESINQIVGSPNALKIIFTANNIAPKYEEYLESLKPEENLE